MKIASLPELYLILAALVPGFIYNGVLTSFVPLRQNKERVVLTLRFLTITAVNYAVSSPLIYLLLAGSHAAGPPALRALAWFSIIFVVPVVLATIHAEIVQHDGFGWLYRLLRLRAINPIPTGWDWVFSRTDPVLCSGDPDRWNPGRRLLRSAFDGVLRPRTQGHFPGGGVYCAR